MRKKGFLLIPALVLFFSCASRQDIIKNELLDQNAEFLSRKMRIAIYQFRESGLNYDTDFALLMRDNIEEILSRMTNITLCERGENLHYIINEYKLQLSGLADESEDILGKIVNADYVVTGEIINLSDKECDLILNFSSVEKATRDYIIKTRLSGNRIAEMRTVTKREFPGRYYDSLLRVLNKQILDEIKTQLPPRSTSYRVFITSIDAGKKEISPIQQYLYDSIRENLVTNKIPIQENILGADLAFKNSLLVLQALETRIYGKWKYLVLEIQQTEHDSYYAYQIMLKSNELKNQKLYLNKSLLIEKNHAVRKFVAPAPPPAPPAEQSKETVPAKRKFVAPPRKSGKESGAAGKQEF